MRQSLLVLTALSIAFAVAAEPPVDAPAPPFVAHDAAGKAVSLAGFRGKTVVLEWTNDGCPFVGHMYKSGVMQDLQRRAAADGVVWLTIISSAPGKQGYLTPTQVQPWKAKFEAAPTDVLLDPGGQLGRLYDARTTPNMVVIDKTGRLVYEGAIDDDPSTDPSDAHKAKNYIALALADLKNGRPIAPAVTKSYGCSVKYP